MTEVLIALYCAARPRGRPRHRHDFGAFFPPPRAAHPQREVFQRHFSPPSGGAFFTDAPSPLLDTRSVKSTDHEDDGTNTTTALVGPTARSPRPLRAALAMSRRLATVIASVVTMSQFVCFMRRPSDATPYVPMHYALHVRVEELLGPSAAADTTSRCRWCNNSRQERAATLTIDSLAA